MITIIVCITCGQQSDSLGCTVPGEQFADRVERVLQSRTAGDPGDAEIQLQRTRCLMSCQRSCSAALLEDGKYSYVFGDFLPDRDSAEALLDFTAGYHLSDSGEVPFAKWPQAIKGHFVARIPPIDPGVSGRKTTPG